MDWSRRRMLLAPLAMAGLLTVGAIAPVTAQEQTMGRGGTIEVTGTGEAEGEAVGAVLQFILRAQFEPTSEPAMDSKFGSTSLPAVTEGQVAAVVDGLIGAGVPEEKIATSVQPAGPYSGMFGMGTAVVAVEIDAETLEQIEQIAEPAVAAGEASGVVFDPVNAAYVAGDCETLDREALVDAVADGRSQAQLLADALGVELGGLVKASKQATYGAYYGGGPSSTACDLQPTLEGALSTYFPPFDPTHAGEIEVYSQVMLSYEINAPA